VPVKVDCKEPMNQGISVVINGDSRQVPAGISVAGLLAHLGIGTGRVAIERNADILPRVQWEQTQVSEGDRYEIVHLVGGG
jgi:thiamine biosynthesis protein ThiS